MLTLQKQKDRYCEPKLLQGLQAHYVQIPCKSKSMDN